MLFSVWQIVENMKTIAKGQTVTVLKCQYKLHHLFYVLCLMKWINMSSRFESNEV